MKFLFENCKQERKNKKKLKVGWLDGALKP